jgi:hypothetical protein
MERILFRAEAASRGLGDGDLARLSQLGDLERVRRGAYVRPAAQEQTPEEQHRLLIEATMPQLGPGAVLSHASAAVLRDLPVWAEALGSVHITRPRRGGGGRRTVLRRHTSPLDPDEVTEVGGWPATVLARTVIDLARSVPFEQGVAAADRALAQGLDPALLQVALEREAGWPGAGRARRVVAFADGRSESAGESVSRVGLSRLGLMPEDLQLPVLDGARQVGRVDFAWPGHRTVGEFDGRVKYGRLLKPGEDAGEAVWREKVREDLLRDLGWQVVRWTWADLDHPETIADRLQRAFRRAHR